ADRIDPADLQRDLPVRKTARDPGCDQFARADLDKHAPAFALAGERHRQILATRYSRGRDRHRAGEIQGTDRSSSTAGDDAVLRRDFPVDSRWIRRESGRSKRGAMTRVLPRRTPRARPYLGLLLLIPACVAIWIGWTRYDDVPA